MRVFRERLSNCLSFPFGIEVGTWDAIVLIPDHCLSIIFLINTFMLRLHSPTVLADRPFFKSVYNQSNFLSVLRKHQLFISSVFL